MVTVTDFKTKKNEEGKTFCSLRLQGGVESVKGKSGRYYLTARSCWISTTFNEGQCRALLGATLAGNVIKVECEPYEYVAKDTGEAITLTHTWEYQPEDNDAPSFQPQAVPEHLVVG